MIPDIVAEIVTVLKANTALNALVSGRVFGGSLPGSQTIHMPRRAVVISPSAGGGDPWANTHVRASGSRLDIRCYGSSGTDALLVHRHVYTVLKHLRPRSTVMSVVPLTSASLLVEPETKYPFVLTYYNALYRETVVVE